MHKTSTSDEDTARLKVGVSLSAVYTSEAVHSKVAARAVAQKGEYDLNF